jgi:hypothetical protein
MNSNPLFCAQTGGIRVLGPKSAAPLEANLEGGRGVSHLGCEWES